ncbi:MAG TPA: hypothetical protein VGH87_19315 [Polyangiaceae bacterium]
MKTVLGLKVIGCLFAIGASFLMMLAFTAAADHDITMPPALAHRVASYAMIATGVSLVELLGVAGVWTFKRWGVYTLAGFSMLNFVIRMHAGDSLFALLGLVSTAVVGAVIAARWSDFE